MISLIRGNYNNSNCSAWKFRSKIVITMTYPTQTGIQYSIQNLNLRGKIWREQELSRQSSEAAAEGGSTTSPRSACPSEGSLLDRKYILFAEESGSFM